MVFNCSLRILWEATIYIIDVGLSWLQNNSVDKMRVETISGLARFSKTTFYKHFNDKYHFIEVILQIQLNKCIQETFVILDSCSINRGRILEQRCTKICKSYLIRT